MILQHREQLYSKIYHYQELPAPKAGNESFRSQRGNRRQSFPDKGKMVALEEEVLKDLNTEIDPTHRNWLHFGCINENPSDC